jgi:hypothetical protein
MSKPSLLRAGWTRIKEYLPPVIAAALMYEGIRQIIGVLRYVVTGLVLRGINAVISSGFRDRMPLQNYYDGAPWQFHVRVAAESVIVTVIGMFIGLWVNARTQPKSAP